MLHVCFYCDKEFRGREEFVVCRVCWSFRACKSCYSSNGNAAGWDMDKLMNRRALLIARDRLLGKSRRRHADLDRHEFTMEHANWDADDAESDFMIGTPAHWEEASESEQSEESEGSEESQSEGEEEDQEEEEADFLPGRLITVAAAAPAEEVTAPSTKSAIKRSQPASTARDLEDAAEPKRRKLDEDTAAASQPPRAVSPDADDM